MTPHQNRLAELGFTINRGAQCMLIGYATDHGEGDCYHMWNPITNGVHKSHDTIWMHPMFYTRYIGQDMAVPPMVIPGIYDPTPAATTLQALLVNCPGRAMPVDWTIRQCQNKKMPTMSLKLK
jgi:hypothetical protein